MKHLLLTTALVTATAAGVHAQSTEATADTSASATTGGEMFRAESTPNELRASDFIGMRVFAAAEGAEDDAYETAQDNWEDVGEINDVILNRDGEVQAVLVDIGGFLGIGERQVAVQMDALDFVSDSSTAENDGDFFLVLTADRATLEGAPAYGKAADDAMAEDTAAADEEMKAEDESTEMSATEAETEVEAEAETAEAEMEEAADDVEQTAENAAEETGDAIEEGAEATAEAASEAGDEIEQTAEAAGEEIEETAEAAGDEAAEAGEEMEQTAEAAGEEMDEAGDEMTDTAEATAPEAEAEAEATATADAGDTEATDEEMQTAENDSDSFGDFAPEGYAAAGDDMMTTETLTGARVYDTNDKWVGEISELVVDDSGKITDAIVDVGGFLGIGEKPVALQLTDLKIMQQEDSGEVKIYTAMAEDELKSMPEFEK